MNKTQKYFFILGVMSFVYWFIYPFINSSDYYWYLKRFFMGEFYIWFGDVSQNLSFVLIIGSGLGCYLFKDNKIKSKYPTLQRTKNIFNRKHH
jgi:hypothetical protein